MLGVIADDFTGASDIASFLTENGFKTIQFNDVPEDNVNYQVDAMVISLKSRSNPANEAISQSLNALNYLQKAGCKQFYFKYCSTFDSTEKGNIGPVIDALLEKLGLDFTLICPALPVNGRTVFNGYLFVGQQLLNESGMRNHPITPMTDANLMRLMDAQSQGKTGLINYQNIEKGTQHIQHCIKILKQQGFRYAVLDSINNHHLELIAQAVQDFQLITGGSGLAGYLAKQKSGGQKSESFSAPSKGRTVILSGSCSLMTNQQVHFYQQYATGYKLDVEQAMINPDYPEILAQWVISHLDDEFAPLVYATVPVDELKRIQDKFGTQLASETVEKTFAKLAQKLKQYGVTHFICAGGETSSIIVQQLGLTGFYIGQQIAAGVPWLQSLDKTYYLALKSGNFGQPDFFRQAQGCL